jgi:hypothetical protein
MILNSSHFDEGVYGEEGKRRKVNIYYFNSL